VVVSKAHHPFSYKIASFETLPVPTLELQPKERYYNELEEVERQRKLRKLAFFETLLVPTLELQLEERYHNELEEAER
jgi:hypothetical protein